MTNAKPKTTRKTVRVVLMSSCVVVAFVALFAIACLQFVVADRYLVCCSLRFILIDIQLDD